MPSVRTYIIVFVLLLVLMGLTIAASTVHLGPFNLSVTLLIAFTKALLVVLFFMHVRYAPRLIWLCAGGSMVWLAILMGITWSDYATRNMTPNRLDDVRTTVPIEDLEASSRRLQ